MKRLCPYIMASVVGITLGVGWLLSSGLLQTHKEEGNFSPIAPVPVLADEGDLPDNAKMEKLAKDDPVAFIENCLRRYHRDVKGYSCTFLKQERLDDKLQPTEIVEVHFKEKPHSVYFNWIQGARKADRALYVEGENDNKLLARPSGALVRKLVGDVVEREVEGADARASGRSPLSQFGMKIGAQRTLAGMKGAKERDDFDYRFEGEIKLKEANDRPCWKLHFIVKAPKEKDCHEVTLFLDKETWLQIGSILKDKDGKLTAAYYFRDLKVNPDFADGQFKREALTQK